MRNLQGYGLWLVLVTISAIVVSRWVNHLILMSDELAGLAAALFLSIFLASWMFLIIDSVMSCFHRLDHERRIHAIKSVKVTGIA